MMSHRLFRWVTVASALLMGHAAQALEPQEIFAKASPSVVVVYTQTVSGKVVQGSGVVLHPGAVATNCHVVADATKIQVHYGASRVSASVLRKYPERDVCLLRVSAAGLQPATIADQRSVQPGDRVYSIGSPLGLELTISEGLVSGLRTTRFGEEIQTSAPISHGSSGGGLFNQDGALVGFTTFSLKDSQNLNFAVPASAAMNLLAAVNQTEAKQREAARADSEGGEPMRDAVKSALIAMPRVQPVRPVFDDERKRLTYLQWLGDMSARLKRLNPDSATRSELLETVWYESVRAGLEPALVLGLIEVVSHFRKYEISPAEARGYMQVATRWSRTIGDGDTARLFHMQTNLRFGCVILRHYLDTAHGDIFAALIRYHGQSLGKSVRLTDPAGVAFVNSVLAARQHWVKTE